MSSAVPDLLAAIVAATGRDLAVRRAAEPIDALAARAAASRVPQGALFASRLARPGTVNVIAECKRRSPSRGVLAPAYDPVAQAQAYARGGAAAISVLTEPSFFDGALAHLAAVRAAVDVPLLRKDFIVDDYQLLEARVAGADAVLLIVGALAPADLARLHAAALAMGLAVLVEVHDEQELDTAVAAGARIIGVNNRNLRTLTVDTTVSERLGRRMPSGVVAVSESGLAGPDDVAPHARRRLRRLPRRRTADDRRRSGSRAAGAVRRRGDAMSRVRIKVCGLTREEDVDAAVAADVDAVGFVLWPESPRAVTAARARELARRLPPWVARVGVMVNPTPGAAADAVRDAGLGVLQLHAVSDAAPFLAQAVPLLWVAPLSPSAPPPAVPEGATLMVDAHDPARHGGTGRTVDWTRAAALARTTRLVLAGGLTPENVAAALACVRPYGVDVSSGVELAPGIKSADRILRFVAAARQSLSETV